MGSGGPKTKTGKEIVSRNATKHAVLATAPVIAGMENAADWNRHRQGIFESTGAVGQLECCLAERIALVLWRMGRVMRYEAESLSVTQEDIERTVSIGDDRLGGNVGELEASIEYADHTLELMRAFIDLSDDAPIATPDAVHILGAALDVCNVSDEADIPINGVPDDISLGEWHYWTAGQVRAGMESIGEQRYHRSHSVSFASPQTGDEVRFSILMQAATDKGQATRLLAEGLRKRDQARRLSLLGDPSMTYPSKATNGAMLLDKVTRYESHLQRQLVSTLHELEAMQDRRFGRAAPLARLDVSGDSDEFVSQNNG